jgi:preprotein translocase subunit SecE
MSHVTHVQDDESLEEESSEEKSRRARGAASRSEGGEEGGGGGISIRLPRLSVFERIRTFLHSVRVEMQKTTWPSRTQVWSTTVVVVIAVIFFGFYLWGCDRLFGQFFSYLEKAVR